MLAFVGPVPGVNYTREELDRLNRAQADGEAGLAKSRALRKEALDLATNNGMLDLAREQATKHVNRECAELLEAAAVERKEILSKAKDAAAAIVMAAQIKHQPPGNDMFEDNDDPAIADAAAAMDSDFEAADAAAAAAAAADAADDVTGQAFAFDPGDAAADADAADTPADEGFIAKTIETIMQSVSLIKNCFTNPEAAAGFMILNPAVPATALLTTVAVSASLWGLGAITSSVAVLAPLAVVAAFSIPFVSAIKMLLA